jgi:uncharacterized membrane protein
MLLRLRQADVMKNQLDEQRQLRLVQLAYCGVMAALVAVATALVQIPNPATRGYINFGDVMIFVSTLVFGPIIGGFAGSVGSSISDVATGYAYYAPYTFVVKGIEGTLAGLISNSRNVGRDVIAVVLAGAEMVTGYFLAEFFPLQFGWGALTEVPGNIFQIAVGGFIGIPIAIIIRRRLPEQWNIKRIGAPASRPSNLDARGRWLKESANCFHPVQPDNIATGLSRSPKGYIEGCC